MSFEKDNSGPLRAGIITNYEIPKSDSAGRVNEILFNLYKNDRYWQIVEKYHEKFKRPVMFGYFLAQLYYTVDQLCLLLLPSRQMFLWQEGMDSWEAPPSDLEPQLQKIFLEGDKFFYVDERSYCSRNEALLVANTVVNLSELVIDEASDLARDHPGMYSKPRVSKEDIHSEFEKNLEMAIQAASEAVLAGYLPDKSKVNSEIEELTQRLISTQ